MATRQAGFNRAERDRRKTSGLCLDCNQPRGVGHSRCLDCNRKRRDKNKLYKQRSRARMKE